MAEEGRDVIRRAGLLGTIAVLAFAGCGGSATASPSHAVVPPSPTASPTLSASSVASMRAGIAADFPRIDGSTSDFPLLRLIACDIYAAACVWSAKASDNVERTFIPDPAGKISVATANAILGVRTTNTNSAYTNLIENRTDLIVVARAPSADEKAAADARGVKLDIRPVALDAFVFLLNVQNPAEYMSVDTLRDIYAGKIKTWMEAGFGTDPKPAIHAYQRERNSGSQELLQSMVMKGTPVIDAPEMIVQTMVGPFNAIGGNSKTHAKGDPLGLGYSVYYYAAVMFSNDGVKLVAIDGVKPTSATIASRIYPLTAEVYAVTRVGASAATARLRDWLLSADGQRVVAKSGYVPIAAQGS